MDYDPFATTFSSSRQNHPWPELDAIIEDMRKRDTKSVLDIGCGNGRFLESYELRAMHDTIHYLGIDSSVGMIEEARRLHPDHHFEVIDMGSISSYPFSITPYDSILFLASFHHLGTQEQRIKTLQDTKKLLSPHGRIYMTNWNLRDQERYDTSKTGDGEYQIKI